MITTSAPGSIMLLGEHAVLHGHRALVLAVDKRLHVSLSPRNDRRIIIDSALAKCEGTTECYPHHPNLSFVCAAIAHCRPNQGFDLRIHADFSHTIGLASSAAVTVATLAALQTWLSQKVEKSSLLKHAVSVIRAVQGRGSGSDAAACVYGGAVAYCADTIHAENTEFSAPFSLYYLGYKTPTPEVIAHVEREQMLAKEAYDQLYSLMGAAVDMGLTGCINDDRAKLALSMRMYQGYMHALGVVDSETHLLLAQLARDPRCLAAKISGSGLGDCIIALGSDLAEIPYQNIAVNMTTHGVCIEQG